MNETYETKYFCNSAEVSRPGALVVLDVIIIRQMQMIRRLILLRM